MRPILLYFLLLLAAAPVAAQPAPPATAAPDTVAALHRLFAARRQRCNLVVVSTLAAGVVGAGVVALVPPTSSGGGSGYGSFSGPVLNDQAIKAFGVGVATVPVVLAELLVFGGWGHRKEQRTIEAWRQHQLPRHLRRQLKARYFQEL